MKTIFALFFKYEFIAFSDFCHRNQRGWIGRTIDHVLYIKVYSLSKGFEKTTYMYITVLSVILSTDIKTLLFFNDINSKNDDKI